jgi:K+-sensing histidine kinase KdpD
MYLTRFTKRGSLLKAKNILVCITQQKTCERLIRKAAELRDECRGGLYVIHVVRNDLNFLDNAREGEALEYLFGISKSVGASLAVLKSDDIAPTIASFASDNGIDIIIIGDSPLDRKENKFKTDLECLLKNNVEIKIIP